MKSSEPRCEVVDILQAASCREFCPSIARCRVMLRRMCRKLGVHPTAGVLSMPVFVVQRFLTGKVRMFPRDRKLIWLVHALLFEPWKLRSPFDLISFGRFVHKPKKRD